MRQAAGRTEWPCKSKEDGLEGAGELSGKHCHTVSTHTIWGQQRQGACVLERIRLEPPTEGSCENLGRSKTKVWSAKDSRAVGVCVSILAGLQRALTWQQVLGNALYTTTTAREPWLLQLRLEQAQLWSPAGRREEGAVMNLHRPRDACSIQSSCSHPHWSERRKRSP